MGEKDISRMSLGNLIGELLDTEKKINSIQEENDQKINLIHYKTSILKQLDKKETDYNSYKPEPVFRNSSCS